MVRMGSALNDLDCLAPLANVVGGAGGVKLRMIFVVAGTAAILFVMRAIQAPFWLRSFQSGYQRRTISRVTPAGPS